MKTRPLGPLPGPLGPRPVQPPGPPGGWEALVSYATLLARFAHRFADRGGVLDARGLDEADFEALESRALAVLAEAIDGGDVATMRFFAENVVKSRASLADDVKPSEPFTRVSSTRKLGVIPEAPEEEGPVHVEEAASAVEVDPADLMATLSSEVHRLR